MKQNLRVSTIAITLLISLFASNVMAHGRMYFRNDSLSTVTIVLDDYNNEQHAIPGGKGATYNHQTPGATSLVTIPFNGEVAITSGGDMCWNKGVTKTSYVKNSIDANGQPKSTIVNTSHQKLKVHDNANVVFTIATGSGSEGSFDTLDIACVNRLTH